MIISWCIIVGNDKELKGLAGAIQSVYDYVDEIIVTANGKEVKKIEEFCKKYPKIKYYYHKWTKDFSAQRNFCASKVRKDADFYGWMDADDVLVGADGLRKIASTAKRNNFDSVFFTYWYGVKFKGEPSEETMEDVELTQMRERLLKPGSVTWKKRIHETPVPVEDLEYKYSQVKYSDEHPIAWLHLGAHREMSQEKQLARMQRNQELLEMELADERKEGEVDPRTLLYLMKIYAELDDPKLHTKNLEMGNEYLMKSGWDAERAVACSLVGRSLGKLGQEKEAKDFLFKSIKEYPYDPILYLYLSRSCFNLGQYREMKHWLEVALQLDPKESFANMNNLLEMKTLSTELLMRYYLTGERNVRKAYQSARLLHKELPSEQNREHLDYLGALNDLDKASEEAHKLMLYYEKRNNSEGVVDVFESMPENMQNLPFAWHMYNKHKEPKVWADNEVCYYASFGREHFEKWSPKSMKKGIGGSETAVIQLSKEWVKKGYKVTVYNDCGLEEGFHDGVHYVNYFKFNPRDSFNVFINWRMSHLAGKVKAKKFIIDLHDLFAEQEYKDYEKYDKLAMKSDYQRTLAPNIPDERFLIISNGI